jgi:FAD/FMN-containing dehydrogenase/Fe-S oxidoreductase
MSLVSLTTGVPVPQADAAAVDATALKRHLRTQLEGEVRFDKVSRALYSTDASVYQIEPLGVVVARSREDVVRTVRSCAQFRCPLTLRGGGTSQAGQAIGAGIQLDTSKYFNRVLEVNQQERWVRVEPGIVLAELNAHLRHYGLYFPVDITTANRAALGGMMANNSSGARSVLYGKTIDHVIEQHVVLADGSLAHFRPLSPPEVDAACAGDTLEGACYRVVRRTAAECAAEVERRFPKILRRVGGYNLDAFTDAGQPFNLAKLIVGSEGTLAVILEAKLNLLPLPKAKAVLAIHFSELLEALGATPRILTHGPSAIEVMDRFVLNHTRDSPAIQRLRDTFIMGDPGALLCVEFYADRDEDLPPRLTALEQDLAAHGLGYHYHHAYALPDQQRIWAVREAALGLSMAMKDDAKSISFVEDTAVAPETLRDYIERFLALLDRHNTTAGIYAHASVGCLHVRPVVNLKTEDGLRKFQSIANGVADLVLEYGGALSGEHGDGLVRSPFLAKMFGPVLYEAFRTIKRTFDPQGILNPGKICDPPPLTANLRFGPGYSTANPPTFFDFSDYGGMSGAVEMCSGLGVCRKTLEGTMCPSFMATREEMHSTRGRANVLRLAIAGRLGEAGLEDDGVKQVLDLCLECRACKAECPVSVDVARFKSEFLAGYWSRHGTPLRALALGNIDVVSKWASRLSPLANLITKAGWINEKLLGIDRRRKLPEWRRRTLEDLASGPADAAVLLFRDTFTNYFNPEVGIAAMDVLKTAGIPTKIAPNTCCGRPLISQGLLARARQYAQRNADSLYGLVEKGARFIFLEPSCLSAMREDNPSLLRGEAQKKARAVAGACLLFEDFLEQECQSGRASLPLRAGPQKILLHGHCHQKAMGLLPSARALLSRIPSAAVVDLDAGCCGMAGSFGYAREHFDISRQIAERRLLPAARSMEPGTILAASGVSCRHQVSDLAGVSAFHPAAIIHSLSAGTR